MNQFGLVRVPRGPRCSWCARRLRWWQVVHCRACRAAARDPQIPAPKMDAHWASPPDPWWRS